MVSPDSNYNLVFSGYQVKALQDLLECSGFLIDRDGMIKEMKSKPTMDIHYEFISNLIDRLEDPPEYTQP